MYKSRYWSWGPPAAWRVGWVLAKNVGRLRQCWSIRMLLFDCWIHLMQCVWSHPAVVDRIMYQVTDVVKIQSSRSVSIRGVCGSNPVCCPVERLQLSRWWLLSPVYPRLQCWMHPPIPLRGLCSEWESSKFKNLDDINTSQKRLTHLQNMRKKVPLPVKYIYPP